MSGDLLTGLRVEPNRLGRLLESAALWTTHVKTPSLRVIELQISRRPHPHASLTSLPKPFDAMCERAGVLHCGSQSFMRFADAFAAAEPLAGPDAGEPLTLNSRLFADLDRVQPCAKSQHIRPWTFRQVRTSARTALVRVVPRHSPHPTDGVVDLDIVGHIMPTRLGGVQ